MTIHKKRLYAGRALTFGILIGITVLSLDPSPPPVEGSYTDKINHFIAYGTLSLFAFPFFSGLFKHGKVLIPLFCILFGILMEILQQFTGRNFDVLDMAANTGGVLLGTLSSLTITAFYMLRIKKTGITL